MALKKKKDVASITAEINADVDNNVATETVVTEPVAETVKPLAVQVEKKASAVADLLTPPKEELKTASLTLRMKPSVKKAFVDLCNEKGVSQADMFEFWVKNIAK